MTSDEDTPAGDGNPDLDKVAVIYAHVIERVLPAEVACRADVVSE